MSIQVNSSQLNKAKNDSTIMLNEAYENMKKRGDSKPHTLFLPLESVSFSIASTLFLNNFEVNQFYRSFLEIWILEPKNKFIPIEKYVSHFPSQYSGLIKQFFSNKDGIQYDLYFVFTCVFIFFKPSHIIALMVSMCRISSNLFISRNQINMFFRNYGFSTESYGDLISILSSSKITCDHCPPDSYLLKDFIEYFCSSRVFFSYLETFRSLLVNFTITFPVYERIIKRINYIYSSATVRISSNQNIIEHQDATLSVTTSGDTKDSKIGISELSIMTSSAMQSNISRHNNNRLSLHDINNNNNNSNGELNNKLINNNNSKIPSESCLQYIVRVLFTNYPPPYCYDYHIDNPTEQSFDKIICSIKQMFNNCEIRRTSFHNRPSLSPQFINRSLNSKSVIIKKSEKLYQLQSPSHFSLRLTNNGNNIFLDSNPNNPSRKSKLHSTQVFPIEESINNTPVIV